MAAWDERLRGVPCALCEGLEGEAEMVVCDKCESPYHPHCLEPKCAVGRGPWYCLTCRGHLRLNGFADVT